MGGFSWEVSDSADADDDYSPEEIRLFGKYELGKLLGYGAFGKVYHARSLRTGQSVAIKAVSKQKVVKRGFADNLKREITVMRRLHHHPNVVKLHEVLATKSKIYFVMEFAKGGGLVSKVDRHNGPLPEDLSHRYFRQLIAAVGFCHERGVFHRDLKLENLLLDEDGNLKMSDFGLSAVRDQIRPDGRLHTVCGTPSYVAPEILKKKGYDGAKADIWSCGVVLFVLTAGYLPFRDSNLMALYRKICKGEFRQPKWTSPDLKRLISRLLDTNPDTRITVDAILRDPWFTKGYNQTKRQSDSPESPKEKDQGDAEAGEKYLNAFDIISLSPGFDLSRLFNDSDASARGERIVSAGTPEEVMERVEKVAMAEEVTMMKKDNWGAKLEGQNGNFAMRVEIYRLTDKMVMVEVEGNGGPGQDFWTNKMKPLLDISVSQPRKSVSGN